MIKHLIFFLLLSCRLNAQIVSTFAGTGISGNTGDNGPATTAKITGAASGVFDSHGNYYFIQNVGHSLRKVDYAGIITTIAGNGMPGYSGDGGPASSSQLKFPDGVFVDYADNIYISDANNYVIRRIDATTGKIATIAGTGSPGYSGEGVLATNAKMSPVSICFDKKGNSFIGDGGHRIYKINSHGIISTYGGVGLAGISGDGGPATSAKCGTGVVCMDSIGNLYIADNATGESRISKIDTFGIVTRFAGTDTGFIYNGDGILAIKANINPIAIAIDKSGFLVFADFYNNLIRKIDLSTGIILTVAGSGAQGYGGDNGLAILAEFNRPNGIAVDQCNNLYVADLDNSRIRKVTFNPEPCTYLSAPQAKNSQAISVYPNPANELLHIDNATANSTYKVMNITGGTQLEGKLKEGSNVIDIHGLYDGMYMISLSPSTNAQGGPGAGGVTKVFKIVVSR